MVDGALAYRIPGASWSLELPAEATRFLLSHTQRRCWSREAVGQIYSSDAAKDSIRVDAVTKLPPRAASHTGVRLDIEAVTRERHLMFERGLHCLGFWHSHPEPVPSPSPDDITMAADHARASKVTFAGLVFIIVGTAPLPSGLGVWVHDGSTLWQALAQQRLDLSISALL